MTASDKRRIEALITLAESAITEEPSLAEMAVASTAHGGQRRRRFALAALTTTVDTLKRMEAEDAPLDAEVRAARRWALEMGREVRRGR
jgi:hypothetical protein